MIKTFAREGGQVFGFLASICSMWIRPYLFVFEVVLYGQEIPPPTNPR